MPRGWFLIVLVVTVLFGAPPIRAEENDFGRPGWFAGAGMTVAGNLFGNALETITNDRLSFDPIVGFNIRGGYRFNRWVAVEFEYERPGTFEGENTRGTTDLELTPNVFTFSAKLYPLKTRFQPYLLLGVGATYLDFENMSGFNLDVQRGAVTGRVGLGLDSYITHNVLVFADVVAVLAANSIENKDIKDLRSSTLFYTAGAIGLMYRF